MKSENTMSLLRWKLLLYFPALGVWLGNQILLVLPDESSYFPITEWLQILCNNSAYQLELLDKAEEHHTADDLDFI